MEKSVIILKLQSVTLVFYCTALLTMVGHLVHDLLGTVHACIASSTEDRPLHGDCCQIFWLAVCNLIIQACPNLDHIVLIV